MRPIRLTMTAFGPYRDRETVDFSLLEDRRLFVISGNTGAGKTTIFDAICYALYGAASGEDRAEPRLLRSHFAGEGVHTSVEFEFGVGRRTYRVMRQMAHRKGGNKSETGGKAELYDTTDGEAVPCVDRFAIAEVNAKLEAIIGLTKEQFSQIVMLPQGEFRKLLTSDTENKEDILRRIFRTSLYRKLEERFHQLTKEQREQLREAQLIRDAYFKQAAETIPLREEGPLIKVLRQEYINAVQLIEALREEKRYYNKLAQSAAERKSALSVQVEEQETALREALAVNGRFTELAGKRSGLDELESRKPEITALERRLELAERAARIEPYEEQAGRSARLEGDKRRQLDAKKKELESAESALIRAQTAFREEEGKEDDRRGALLELERLKELVPLVRTLDERRAEVERLLKREHDCEAALSALEQKLTAERDQKRTDDRRIREMEEKTARLPELLERLGWIRSKYNLIKELADLENRIGGFAKAEEEQERIVARYREEHDRLEALWLEGQAGLLAAHLHDGEPCPVCGSTAHPGKAEPGHEVPSREALQQAKERLLLAQSEISGARAQAAAAHAGWEARTEAMAEYDISAADMNGQLLQAEMEGKRLRATTDQLKEQAALLAELRRRGEQRERELERLQADKERMSAELQQCMLVRSTKQSLLGKEVERLPESLRTPDLLARRLDSQQQLWDRLTAAWKSAGEQLQRAQTRLAEERANTVQLAAGLKEAEASSLQASGRFAEEQAKAGFAGREQYEAAKMQERDRLALKEKLESYKTQTASLSQQIAELERLLQGLSPADTEAMASRIAELKEELEKALHELQSSLHYGREAERLETAVGASQERVAELESRLEQTLDIYQMLKGDNPLKISFERYILIEYLEQILHAANIRLRKLSGGQFLLQRSDRLETRGKQSGLGLDVYDAYTGQNRDVKSLSGGEKFNASLCLALGMTDVIQANQGGVSIEMMLIDEGFGSLDEESLHKAIAALIDLQRAGRMIGVISHVQELKQAFPAALEVTKTKEGYSRTAIFLK
ncbi:AAA family ATPase [Paenibacillus tarimensis]